ncbi:MAG: pyridoxal phosphate-dependent aminotransferase [Rikenellaceae bacterium]
MSAVFSKEQVADMMAELRIADLSSATIRQVLSLAAALEQKTGIPFVRMDQGIPGLPPCQVGIDAEKRALDAGVASQYPLSDGLPELKSAATEFVKAFFNVDISPVSCIPTTGSVAGSFSSFAICSNLRKERNKVLFIEPGFPIQKLQLRVLGVEHRSFEIFDYRGEALRQKLDDEFGAGDISAIIYSSPNNPSWITFTQEELAIIGEMATKHDVIVIEDLAYLGMDSRTDYSIPNAEPYVPTVAKYTDNYMLMVSGSKIYSYAGQRIAVLCVSDKLFNRSFEELDVRYGRGGHFGTTLVGGVLDMLSSGITHSAQYGLAAMFRASVNGEYDFVAETSEYARRAVKMKEMLHRHGFHIVYDNDIDREIGDGFFFTIGYKDMSCAELVNAFIHYGISSISLSSMGSEREGVRACTSRMTDEMLAIMDERLARFAADQNS